MIKPPPIWKIAIAVIVSASLIFDRVGWHNLAGGLLVAALPILLVYMYRQ